MTLLHQIYRCPICGNVVELVGTGAGELVCCGKPMRLETANGIDASKEKHVPVISGDEGGIEVKVGSMPHPMEPDHYIEWIEVINGSYVNRKHLKPGDKPEAAFYVPAKHGLIVRAYCNKHGLWKA